MFWDQKFWKEKSSCIIFLQEKFKSQKKLCKRFWEKKLEINILTPKKNNQRNKRNWRKNLQHIKVRKKKVRKWSRKGTETIYRPTCMYSASTLRSAPHGRPQNRYRAFLVVRLSRHKWFCDFVGKGIIQYLSFYITVQYMQPLLHVQKRPFVANKVELNVASL